MQLANRHSTSRVNRLRMFFQRLRRRNSSSISQTHLQQIRIADKSQYGRKLRISSRSVLLHSNLQLSLTQHQKPANVFGENPSSHSGKKHPFGETTEDTRKSFSFGTSPLSGTQAKTTNNALNDDTARKRTKSSANSSAVQQKLSELESVLHGYSMKVRAFIGSPPTTEAFGQNVYASYSSSIFENVIAELDQVEADGEDRDRRRKLVKEAEELMKELDAMVPPSKVWKPEASFRATDRTGDFKIHPIELD